MALLASSWLIIESFVIPDGFLKWFYLSFYIHPIFLFVCQIFLWLKLLQKCFLIAIFYLFYVRICVYSFFKKCVIYICSLNRLSNIEDTAGFESFEPLKTFYKNQVVISYSNSSIAPLPCQLQAFKLDKNGSVEEKDFGGIAIPCEVENMEQQTLFVCEDENTINVHLSSISSTSGISVKDESLSKDDDLSSVSSSNSPAVEDPDMNQYSPLVDSNNSLAVERELIANRSREEDHQDPFYKKYTERMRWFDDLNNERTSGISAILNKQAGDVISSFESMKPADLLVPYISWSKMEKRKLLKSLESDFELVYVAQSCLSWEALHHQYRKVEALASSSSQNGVFYDNAAGEFQKFQVLLERFMEDERCELGKRYWNYVRGRFSLKSLIQVPMLSGFYDKENEELKREAINVKEVMKAIEKCMLAFWIFVKTDYKKPRWKLSSSLWTNCPPVEDPRDLGLLADLTRKLQKKELWLKDSQGKLKCWFRRVVNPTLEDSQKMEILFTMIDMKLISRVLQMSVLSTSQLKWCQEKLDNIEFKEGKIMRACTSGPLFPP